MASVTKSGVSTRKPSRTAPVQGGPKAQEALEKLRNVWVRKRVTLMLVAALAVGAILFLQGHQLHSPLHFQDPMTIGGLSLIGVGLLIRSWAASILNKSRTLATEGPYSACRNPLYLGSFLMLLGFFLMIDNVWAISVLLTVIFLTYPPTIVYEEARMANSFGEVWTTYSAEVGRILPRFPRSKGPISISLWFRNGEYNAVLACLIGLVGIEAWRAVLSR